MLMRWFRSRPQRRAKRENVFVPRLESLEDRVTPAALSPLDPAVSSQLALSTALVAQHQNLPTPPGQLTTLYLSVYTPSAQQNPVDTNALVRAEFLLVTDLSLAIFDAQLQSIVPQLPVSDPALNQSLTSAQNAILSNPVRNTPAGAQTAVLGASLALNVVTSPLSHPSVAAFQLSYYLAIAQNGCNATDLNGLVRCETILALGQLSDFDSLLNVNDPTASTVQTNAQNAIASNPAYHTRFGFVTGILAHNLATSAFLAP